MRKGRSFNKKEVGREKTIARFPSPEKEKKEKEREKEKKKEEMEENRK
jgi:hypothetical protein